MKLNKLFALICFFISMPIAFAQETAMADSMRAEGKIYVVVGVLALIFLVLFAYLISIDRKLRKLEENSDQ